MACAGYLVWNNTTVVYAEITNGLLVCSASAPLSSATCEHGDAHADEADADATPSNQVLPLLAPKHLVRSESPTLLKLKRRLSDAQPEDEDDMERGSESRTSCSSESYASSCDGVDTGSVENGEAVSRVLRLCGHVVRVVDCNDERDDALPPVPFSFRVKTEKLTLHADASFSTKPVDSLLLAAVDQKAKDEWMKRLARWNRYGWRETTEIAATAADYETLKHTVECWQEKLAGIFNHATESACYTSRTSVRSSRRRFYRPSLKGTMEESMADGDPWFHTHVIKTHI